MLDGVAGVHRIARRAGLLVVWLGLGLGLGLAAGAAAADLYVAPAGSDTGNDCSVAATPCRTLQHAVDVAAVGDSVLAGPGTYSEDLVIGKSIGLSGAGAAQTIVDGKRLETVVQVAKGAEVALSQLTLRNGGTSTSDGGGLDNRGTVTLTDMAITENDNSIYWGGAIYNEGLVTATRVTLSNNKANQGGALCNNYGGQAFFTDSVIRDNVGFQGGAYLCGTSGLLKLDGCQVIGNTATDFGGGLFSGSDSSTMVLTGTLVAGNTGFAVGGMLARGLTVVDGSTFEGNHASGLYAGGIYQLTGTLRMTNSTVSGNTAAYDGGGLYVNGGAIELTHVTVFGNVSQGSGGGLYVQNASDRVTASHSILAGNTAVTDSPDCHGSVESRGYNLVEDTAGCIIAGDVTGLLTGVDPLLGDLLDNGGPTRTHALLAGSPAIDAGNPAGSGVDRDQRGEARPADGDCDRTAVPDLGAVEVACTSLPSIGVFESDRADLQGAFRVGDADVSPYSRTPPVAPRLYYQLDDGNGFPAKIQLTKDGAGILIHF